METQLKKSPEKAFSLGLYGGKGFGDKGGIRKMGEAKTAKTLGPPVYPLVVLSVSSTKAFNWPSCGYQGEVSIPWALGGS